MIFRFLFFVVVAAIISSCVSHDLYEPIDCEAVGPSLQIDSVYTATSCNTFDGSIHTTPSGGREPYNFFLNDQPAASSDFTKLAAGVYSVRVQDANGCDTVISNIMVMAQDFSFTTTITKDSLCLDDSGQILVEVMDGNPPYTYKINNGTFSDVNSFTALHYGNYVVTVKDNSDCSIALNINVPRGITGTSWESDIRPLMVTYCALNGCHNGITKPDLRIYDKAKFYASSIKSKTQDRSMPFEGTLTQSQIDIIACWVDDGAPEN